MHNKTHTVGTSMSRQKSAKEESTRGLPALSFHFYRATLLVLMIIFKSSSNDFSQICNTWRYSCADSTSYTNVQVFLSLVEDYIQAERVDALQSKERLWGKLIIAFQDLKVANRWDFL